MPSHLVEILLQGVWSSLTGGWFYDPHLSLLINTVHMYTWIFLFVLPFAFYIIFPSNFTTWFSYALIIFVFFTIVKLVNYQLNRMFDKNKISVTEKKVKVTKVNITNVNRSKKASSSRASSSPNINRGGPLTIGEWEPRVMNSSGAHRSRTSRSNRNTPLLNNIRNLDDNVHFYETSNSNDTNANELGDLIASVRNARSSTRKSAEPDLDLLFSTNKKSSKRAHRTNRQTTSSIKDNDNDLGNEIAEDSNDHLNENNLDSLAFRSYKKSSSVDSSKKIEPNLDGLNVIEALADEQYLAKLDSNLIDSSLNAQASSYLSNPSKFFLYFKFKLEKIS